MAAVILMILVLSAGRAEASTTCDGQLATIMGTSGSETLTGTSGADVIFAGGGADLVKGLGGNDVLCGGAGGDTILGGGGGDSIVGGGGTDTVQGGSGADTLIGGAGNDRISGGTGTDSAGYTDTNAGVNADLSAGTATGDGTDALSGIENLTGGGGDDTLTGDDGGNVLSGGSGADTLIGGAGNDTVSGGTGTDTLTGGDGNDVLDGSTENDALFGDPGDDNLTGGSGADYLDGGSGKNVCNAGDDPGDVMENSCDSIPPILAGFQWTTPTVSTGSGPATVIAVAEVTDDLSGVRSAQCLFDSPSGAAPIYTTGNPVLLSNTDKEWDYQLSATLPQYSEQGTWKIRWCLVEDQTHNSRYYQRADMNALGFPTTFEQVDPGDSTPPELVWFDITPNIATGSGPVTLTATADVTEADSGVGFVQCLYRSPNGATGIYTSSAPQLISQSGSSWTYGLSATMPQYSAQGTWTIEWCLVQDNANNTRWYYTADLNGLGFPVSFDQIDAGDSTPPQLIGLEFTSPSTVNTQSGPATITVTTHATDDLSGLHVYMSCRFLSPDGMVPADFTGYTATPGALDGFFDLSVTMPQYSQPGTWSVSSCRLDDKVGNGGFVSRSQMEAAGLPTTFTIQ